MTVPPRFLRPTGVALACAAAVALTVPVALTLGASAASAKTPTTVAVSPKGSVVVHARGNGHGHGMSQYGARGAAAQGLSYRKILSFYYRHTSLQKTQDTHIRVLLSGYGSTTTVSARPALRLSGRQQPLPTTPARYRLVAGSGSTLTLQQLPKGAHASWKTVETGLPNLTAFHAVGWSPVQIFSPDGTSALYYGRLRAVRSGSGVETVDKLSIDRYTAGVVPYEMPSSWQQAAVRAQAVAARTYGVYAVEHPRNKHYDICDTTMCQVYGGYEQRNASNAVTASDYAPAATATSDEVLTYRSQPIFAQFSASNGGWEDSGGEPYLVSQRDPYDTSASGDPYDSMTEKVSASSVASYFGLAKLTGITITGRDGNGAWGGRVVSAKLTGRNSSGGKTTVRATGYDLQYAFGLGTTLYTVAAH